jgi:hypothetical protein
MKREIVMRLYDYLNESRTKSIPEFKALDTIVTECKDIASRFLDDIYIS